MIVLVYVLSLPLAVWALASIFALVDQPDTTTAVVRIGTRCLLVLAFIYMVGPQGRAPVFWGFATVIVLHLSMFGLSRWLIIRRGFNVKRTD